MVMRLDSISERVVIYVAPDAGGLMVRDGWVEQKGL
jgi:hypothetical protein